MRKEVGKSNSISFTSHSSVRGKLFQGFGERSLPALVEGVNWSTAFRIKWVEPLLCYVTDDAISGESVIGGNISLVTEL